MHPKYGIGDTVYVLLGDKVTTETVMGVVATFDSDLRRYDTKKVPKFREFRYFFDMKTSAESYGWIAESRLFTSKEELLAAL
jgi:hypothetical protein